MKRYRYEATDLSGVPVHGTTDAQDEAALKRQLAVRRLQLISATELSLENLIHEQRELLPRLQQLRVGEQLREALLTGVPAHEAVRAISAEPLSHPILGVMPWLMLVSLLVLLITAIYTSFTGAFVSVGAALGFAGIVLAFWFLLKWRYQTRPKRLLRLIATRLEAGDDFSSSLQTAVPRELGFVMRSSTDDQTKGRIAADLIPSLLGSNLRTQQFIMALTGPLILFSIVLVIMHSALLFVVPQFEELFTDFGIELPAFSRFVLAISGMVVSLGATGLWFVLVSLTAGLVLLACGISRGWMSELLAKVPLVGVAFLWGMQARVARILAAMIRNGCPYGEALRTATAGSGFISVRQQGELLATELESHSGQLLPVRQLSGLPLALLLRSPSGQHSEERQNAIADTFQALSEMLDATTLGQGRVLSVLLQFVTILVTGFLVCVGVLAMFLPLISLLSNLA